MEKYKNSMIIGIVVLVVVLGIILLVKVVLSNREEPLYKNKPEIEALVEIEQAEVSAFVFATQESPQDHRLHINFTPFINLKVEEKEISRVYIENFKGESGVGELILIHPTSLSTDTLSRTFLFTDSSESIKNDDLVSQGPIIEYEVVSQITQFNQVSKSDLVNPYFGIILKEIGTVDYDAILARDNVFEGSKYLEYSGVSEEKLNTTIQFDIKIVFVDGNQYVKRFRGILEGKRLVTEISPLITLEVVEE